MRLLLLSDSHTRHQQLVRILNMHPDIEEIFFLGDGLEDIEKVQKLFPNKSYHIVSGNTDLVLSDPPHRKIEEIGSKRVFYTHGNRYKLHLGLEKLAYYAYQNKADVVFFGHTHTPTFRMINGIPLINPGAVMRRWGEKYGSYAIVDISPEGEISVSHFALPSYRHYIRRVITSSLRPKYLVRDGKLIPIENENEEE